MSKTVLITGSSTGFGRDTAETLARAGHHVFASMRAVEGKNREHAEALRSFVSAERLRLEIVELDVTSSASVERAVASVLEKTGRIDVLVNNAGVLRAGAFEDVGELGLREVMETNFFGALLLTQAVLPQMRRQRSGYVIMISSLSGIAGLPGDVAYTASKFAIRGMTKVAARELGRFGIRVNSVHPGGVLTRMTLGQAEAYDGQGAAFLASLPIARFAEPIEISRLVAFLASDDSSYSTGSEFVADGGVLSGPGY